METSRNLIFYIMKTPFRADGPQRMTVQEPLRHFKKSANSSRSPLRFKKQVGSSSVIHLQLPTHEGNGFADQTPEFLGISLLN